MTILDAGVNFIDIDDCHAIDDTEFGRGTHVWSFTAPLTQPPIFGDVGRYRESQLETSK